ncbi:hypothetical protein Patl1_15060 [Pistacia atlantica]|uniref:Uncharacterized protein n=1 Tax=Pistacia atlantica TaxID=434234 RepID=A0ACC1B958_9ROSI|nr:hypothetical protein Patl1_15060 [Pistacia atlantica]
MLLQDQARVDSIQSKLSKNSGRADNLKQTYAANLPAKDGSVEATSHGHTVNLALNLAINKKNQSLTPEFPMHMPKRINL